VAKLSFLKMHGCGNDFIVIDDADNAYSWEELSGLALRLCDRRFGIGGDGLIALGHSPFVGDGWPEHTDYEMRYLNADGSRAEMCGNGIRCTGKFAADVLNDKRTILRMMTGAGVLPVELHRDSEGIVHSATVGMGVPHLSAAEVPTTLTPSSERVIAIPLEIDGETLNLTCVSMGNPHAVSFVNEITDHHVLELGPKIEKHPAFPKRVNVEFVQQLMPGPGERTRMRMRVWERGCGETWACGTGACASVVAAVLTGRVAHGEEVDVVLNGGILSIVWPGAYAPVRMSGPAETVFAGEIEI
jgi:diaminopimelate epimerase